MLVREGDPDGNPWGLSFRQGLFNMTSDSGLFRTREDLEKAGATLDGNAFVHDGERLLPLYEAKMIHHFDHRWATYEGTSTRDVEDAEKADPARVTLPRYWVPEREVAARLEGKWDRGWLLGWRDICRSTDERTVIAGVFPRVGVGHKIPLMMLGQLAASEAAAVQSALCSLSLDYVARQKVGSTSLTYFYLKQFAFPSVPQARRTPTWCDISLVDWIAPRTLELTYTAHDLAPFAHDLGYHGPPFRWDEDRRFLLRAELDAAFFHLYGLERDDVDYVLDTFPIVKRKDEAAHGEYRTKRVILELYDRMAEAARTGEPYQTVLDPPPADPRAAHRDECLEGRGCRCPKTVERERARAEAEG